MSTKTPPPNRIVFYDHPCIDGAASAWVFKQRFGDDVRLVPLDRRDLPERKRAVQKALQKGCDKCEVYFVDTQPGRRTLDYLLKRSNASKVTVIDHHKKTFGKLRDYKTAYEGEESTSTKRGTLELVLDADAPSAAAMAHQHLFPQERLPKAIEYIGLMEPPVSLRTLEDRHIAAAIDAIQLQHLEDPITAIDTIMKTPKRTLLNDGEELYEQQKANIRKALKHDRYYVDIEIAPGETKRVLAVNADRFQLGRTVDLALMAAAGRDKNVERGIAFMWYDTGTPGRAYLSVRASVKRKNPSEGYSAHEVATHLANKTLLVEDEHGERLSSGGGHDTSAAIQTTEHVFKQRFLENARKIAPEELAQQRQGRSA